MTRICAVHCFIIPAEPPVQQMNFNVTIHNGPSMPSALPQPYSAPPSLALPPSVVLDLTEIELDEFMAD